VDGIEVANAVVYGGQTAAQLPLDKLSRPLTFVFTYIFPLAIINWIPARALLSGDFNALALAAPVIGWLFFALGALVWKIGVRAYTSTGS
jgi:ABC-2 type transport system permease protein